jgi:hypothetical protein
MGHNEPKAIMLRIAEEYGKICEEQSEPTTDTAKIISVEEQTNSQ